VLLDFGEVVEVVFHAANEDKASRLSSFVRSPWSFAIRETSLILRPSQGPSLLPDRSVAEHEVSR
jgi:hypothetical protein